MKKLFLIAIALLGMSFTSVAQDSTKTDITPLKSYTTYVTASLSMHGGANFQETSYPALEVGITQRNISYGFVFGRGNLVNMFENDRMENYFWELKFSPSYRLGDITGSLVAGGGAYFDSTHYFAELGVGLGYSVGDFTYGLTFSNWDTVNYVTPSVSYTF